MTPAIDFSKAYYKGDAVEETYKSFTANQMPFWWHFRAVLVAGQAYQQRWQHLDGTPLPDNEQAELIALSLLNYAVYTSLAEAVTFHEELEYYLFRSAPHSSRLIDVRRAWKAMYSSLYSSFNALCNIVSVTVACTSPFGSDPAKKVWNYSPGTTLKLVGNRGLKALVEPLSRCQDNLEIRDHLDHYWTIWMSVAQNQFLLDKNFRKGYIAVRPDSDVQFDLDASELARNHLRLCTEDFNSVYKEIAAANGHLDQYLSTKGWKIDYSAPIYEGKRPLP